MKKSNSIFNSIISLLVSQCMVKVFGLIYKLYLANKEGFGDAGNAIYNSGYQIYALLLTISSIGVPNAVAKLVAEAKHNSNKCAEVLKSALVAFCVIGFVGSVGLAVFADFISNKLLNIGEAKKSIIALSPAIFNVCLISVYRGYFNGINKINVTAKSQTIEQILKTAFTIALVEITYVVSLSNTVIMAAAANFATTLATLCSFIYLYKKNNLKNVKVKYKLKSIIKILSVSIPISLSAILASLNRNIDSVTIVRYLKNFIGENEAKLQYGILSGKVDVLSSVPVSFIIAIATTIIPTISELKAKRNYASIKNMGKIYILFTILLALPCSFCMIIFSDQILQFLFNSTSGSLLLKVSAVSIIFIALEQIVHAILQGLGKVFVPTISLSIGVILKTILNVKLLNLSFNTYFFSGIIGACAATVVCHIVAFCISFYIMKKNLKIKFEICKYVLKPVLASCIMALCLHYTYFALNGIIMENIAIIVAVVIAIFVYIFLIFFLKILGKDELSLIPILSDFTKFKKKLKK